jgi:alanine racemase
VIRSPAAVAAARWAWAEVDLDAVAHNVRALRALVAPTPLWAVVKADAYGHGAVPVADAARRAGAAGLCVALVQEGAELRAAGIDGPVLVLSEQPAEQQADLVALELTPTLYTAEGIDAFAAAVRAARAGGAPGGRRDVHLKLDTGMHRVGAPPAELAALAERVRSRPELHLAAVYTHLATADEPDADGVSLQLARFDAAVAGMGPGEPGRPARHAANSAGALAHPAAHHDLVRAGIALYGIAPSPALRAQAAALRPVLGLHARVAHVQRVPAGEAVSYGWRHRFTRDTTVATLPLGYADGVPRRLYAAGGEVLLGGRRRPIVGVVTMDQLMIDCGDDEVARGDHAVLLGRQGDEVVTPDEWAERLGTIAYEIVCAISPRVPRRYLDRAGGPDGTPGAGAQ